MSDENPFSEQVEEVEQYCWRDGARRCGVDCVAYDEKCEADAVWSPCLLLNLRRAQAKSHANIAAELKRQNDFYEGEAQELIKREGQRRVEMEAELEKERQARKKAEAEAYAAKVKEMDAPPPKITT